MNDKGLVLDANILVRAVLGKRVRSILEHHRSHAKFFSPVVCYEEARRHLPAILKKRKIDPSPALDVLNYLPVLVVPVSDRAYSGFEKNARTRMRFRDLDDWPVLALAIALNLPIWTEDQDLFGTGVATWTTDRIELFFENS